MVSYWHCDKYEIKYRTNLLLPEVLLSVLIFFSFFSFFSVSTTICFTLMFYYPRSKAHDWKAKPALVQRTQPQPRRGKGTNSRGKKEGGDSLVTAVMPHLRARSGTHRRVICDTERVWHGTAPLECLGLPEDGACRNRLLLIPRAPLKKAE